MPTTISGSTGVSQIQDGVVTNADIDSVAASKLTGTIADARFPTTLPAISAANLTNIPAANITGTLPAISGANLTGITGGLVLVASSVDLGEGGTTYATITIDQCFTSTYDTYLIVGTFGVEAGGNVRFQWRVGGSGSESTHTTGNYRYVGMDYENQNNSLVKNEIKHETDSELPIAIAVTPHISDGCHFNMWIYGTSNTAADSTARLTSSTYDAQNDIRDRTASLNSGNVDATGFLIANSSGNMDEHAIRVYGLVNS